jgi:ParB family transcriptional regulator, chromosome partitioning protein
VTKDRRLGKGLAALLGTPLDGEDSFGGADQTRAQAIASMAAEARSSGSEDEVTTIPIRSMELNVAEIDPNPFQPRRQFNVEEIESLAESLKTHQQIQPILVRKVGDRYQLISGERRYRATIHAGFSTIRAEVREADDRLVSELAIIENLQRKDLNAIEKALSFRRYIDEHQCTQDELAKRLSLDRTTITGMLRLLDLPQPVVDMVQAGGMTGGHAKPLLALGSEALQIDLARQIMTEGWSVRAVEKHVNQIILEEDAGHHDLRAAVANAKRGKVKEDNTIFLEQQMKMGLGTKVDIQRTSRGRGRIVVHFTSLEEFDRLHTMFSQATTSKAA